MKSEANVCQKWLMLAPKKSIALKNDDSAAESFIVSFPHPKTSKSVKFLMKENEKCNDLFEITKHLDSPSSWFVDNEHVKSDGSLFVVSVFDPLYIFLGQLYKENNGKFVILNQLFSSINASANTGQTLLKCLANKSQLLHISDSAGINDLTAYRYNEAKTLAWLKLKVERTAAFLKDTSIYIPDQTENSNVNEVEMRYASGLVCEYLPDSLRQTLLKHLGISERTEKRPSAASNPTAKKAKLEALEDYTKFNVDNEKKNVTKKKNLTRTQKTLSKIDKKGMKPLSSFFAAKPKKRA